MATAMAKGTIVVIDKEARWRALARAENQAGLRPGMSAVHQVSSGRRVQFGTLRAAIAAMSPMEPPTTARSPGSLRLAPAATISALSASLRGMALSKGTSTRARTRTPTITHCHHRVRVCGAVASRSACISGTDAARRAGPIPPRMQNSIVTAMVNGTPKPGMMIGRSCGNTSNSRQVSR